MLKQLLAEEKAKRQHAAAVEKAKEDARASLVAAVRSIVEAELEGVELVSRDPDAHVLKIETRGKGFAVRCTSPLYSTWLRVENPWQPLGPGAPSELARVRVFTDSEGAGSRAELVYEGEDPAAAAEAFLRKLVTYARVK